MESSSAAYIFFIFLFVFVCFVLGWVFLGSDTSSCNNKLLKLSFKAKKKRRRRLKKGVSSVEHTAGAVSSVNIFEKGCVRTISTPKECKASISSYILLDSTHNPQEPLTFVSGMDFHDGTYLDLNPVCHKSGDTGLWLEFSLQLPTRVQALTLLPVKHMPKGVGFPTVYTFWGQTQNGTWKKVDGQTPRTFVRICLVVNKITNHASRMGMGRFLCIQEKDPKVQEVDTQIQEVMVQEVNQDEVQQSSSEEFLSSSKTSSSSNSYNSIW